MQAQQKGKGRANALKGELTVRLEEASRAPAEAAVRPAGRHRQPPGVGRPEAARKSYRCSSIEGPDGPCDGRDRVPRARVPTRWASSPTPRSVTEARGRAVRVRHGGEALDEEGQGRRVDQRPPLRVAARRRVPDHLHGPDPADQRAPRRRWSSSRSRACGRWVCASAVRTHARGCAVSHGSPRSAPKAR